MRATFFVLGQVARDEPDLVREIERRGHEIGLHGDMHRRVDQMDRADFRDDLARNLTAVEAVTRIPPSGYRAAYHSVGTTQGWFWEELAQAGLEFDASVFPKGWTLRRRFPFVDSGGLRVVPTSTVRVLGLNLPFSGGFYFRALPYSLVRRAVAKVNREGHPVVFYFHPWEFDPERQAPESVTLRERLSHFGFLRGARKQFLRLLEDVPLGPINDPAPI